MEYDPHKTGPGTNSRAPYRTIRSTPPAHLQFARVEQASGPRQRTTPTTRVKSHLYRSLGKWNPGLESFRIFTMIKVKYVRFSQAMSVKKSKFPRAEPRTAPLHLNALRTVPCHSPKGNRSALSALSALMSALLNYAVACVKAIECVSPSRDSRLLLSLSCITVCVHLVTARSH